jgi:hypothetical protein
MTHVRSRYDRFNEWLDTWLKDHLPLWLYREITLQPDRVFLLKPSDDPRVRKAELRLIYFLIAASAVLFILSIALKG